MTLVLDQALVGCWQPSSGARNIAFAAVSSRLLAALPLGPDVRPERGRLLGTSIFGQIARCSCSSPAAGRGLTSVFGRPGHRTVETFDHQRHWPSRARFRDLPTSAPDAVRRHDGLAPSTNAAFYAAWTVINVAYLVPASLATVMFAVGAKDRRVNRRKFAPRSARRLRSAFSSR